MFLYLTKRLGKFLCFFFLPKASEFCDKYSVSKTKDSHLGLGYIERKDIFLKRSMKNILVRTQILSTEMHVVGRCRKERKKRPK